MNKKKQIIKQLRIVGIVEGVSYIVLLAISMPLKYIFKMPKPVMVNGYIHGFLFVLLAVLIMATWVICKWSFKRALTAGIASLVPFGTFWFDKTLKKEYKSL